MGTIAALEDLASSVPDTGLAVAAEPAEHGMTLDKYNDNLAKYRQNSVQRDVVDSTSLTIPPFITPFFHDSHRDIAARCEQVVEPSNAVPPILHPLEPRCFKTEFELRKL